MSTNEEISKTNEIGGPEDIPEEWAPENRRRVREWKDDARAVAAASNGRLDTSAVRILRALRDDGGEMAILDMAKAAGLVAPKRKDSGKVPGPWNIAIRNLYALGMIEVYEVEGVRARLYAATSKGVEALERYEALAKAAR